MVIRVIATRRFADVDRVSARGSLVRTGDAGHLRQHGRKVRGERLASKWPHLFSKGALEALTKTVQAAWALYPSDARIIEDVLGQLVNMHALSGPLHGTCC